MKHTRAAPIEVATCPGTHRSSGSDRCRAFGLALSPRHWGARVPAANGALQITYSGKALYWFAKDKAPGQVKGNVTDEWGKWYSVVTAKPSAGSKAPSTTSAGTGGTAF